MRRSRSSRNGRFCDFLLFVVILGLVLVNIFITMSYFYREAKRQEASQPSPLEAEDKNEDQKTGDIGRGKEDDSRVPRVGSDSEDDPTYVTSVYNASKHVWPFRDMEDMLAKMIPTKYWGPNVSFDVVEGYNFSTLNVANQKEDEDWANAYHRYELLEQQSGCDALTVPFLKAQDTRCIQYLTDIRNWRVLRPLAMGYDQRTIKFEVEFAPIQLPDGSNISMLGSILKVPQRLFPNEAFSEVASYHADRVMHVMRIPPTGWVCIPLAMIRESMGRFGSSVETVDEFLEESKVHNYTEWIEKDLFQYVESMHGFGTTESGEPCVGASIQLKVADVAHLLDSVLKIPYVPHNESWFRFLDIAHHHDDKGHPLFYKERFAPSILHISELNTFDYVIGNGDRSPNKNNFVVGGCIRRHECGNVHRDRYFVRHPNHPTYVHLDQGMGFYGNPRRNPIGEAVNRHKKDSDEEDTFCLFRVPLINRLVHLHTIVEGEGRDAVSRWERLMMQRLPDGVKHFVTSHTLKQCHDRMTKLLHLVERCNRMSNSRLQRYIMAP